MSAIASHSEPSPITALLANDRQELVQLLHYGEDWLMERVLRYALNQGFTRYTSTLQEAWRLSIDGLSQALLKQLEHHISSDQIELSPEESYQDDPACTFGIEEAKKHRQRGVNLPMFLGLMKYYRQGYQDLVETRGNFERRKTVALFIDRFFDRIEIAFCAAWTDTGSEQQIGELSRKNLALTNEKNHYLTIFESLNSPVLLLNEQGNIKNLNFVAARDLFQISQPGSVYYNEHLAELKLTALDPLIESFLASDQAEEQFQLPLIIHGQERIYEGRFKRMLDISHKFAGITLMLRNITDNWRANQEILEQNLQLNDLLKELEDTKDQLVQSEKLAAIGQLSAGIAHEINNPVSFIKANCQTIKNYTLSLRDLLDQIQMLSDHKALNHPALKEALLFGKQQGFAEIRDDLEAIFDETQQGIDRVIHIVRDLKNFARTDSGSFAQVEINTLIKQALTVTWNEIKYKARVQKALADLAPIRCIEHQITQVLVNILLNAAQAIEDNGLIKITSRQAKNQIVISISDNGRGMTTEQQNRVFEPFFTTKSIGKGTGLGLSISYGIMQRHGGDIQIESESGVGTTFHLFLPRFANPQSSH